MEAQERLAKGLELGRYFTPAAPVNNQALFAGRTEQLSKVVDVAGEVGKHAIIYGERGVGKTSLARVLAGALGGVLASSHINCSRGDEFEDVWRKALAPIRLTVEGSAAGIIPQSNSESYTADKLLPAEPTSFDVLRALQVISEAQASILFIDEFDRVDDPSTIEMMADTIKAVSDYGLRITVVLVGVADSVADLIKGHESVERSLVQVQMPRMSIEELTQIVYGGADATGMEFAENEVMRIARLSRGLPHYTHLLALHAARHAVDSDRVFVDSEDVEAALAQAVRDAEASTLVLYEKATASTRDSNYSQVLLACALAHASDLGFFTPADVRDPLSAIMGKTYDIPRFQSNLNGLASPDRGPALDKIGRPRSYRYRFSNPLLQPYVLIRGLRDGDLDEQLLIDVMAA